MRTARRANGGLFCLSRMARPQRNAGRPENSAFGDGRRESRVFESGQEVFDTHQFGVVLDGDCLAVDIDLNCGNAADGRQGAFDGTGATAALDVGSLESGGFQRLFPPFGKSGMGCAGSVPGGGPGGAAVP